MFPLVLMLATALAAPASLDPATASALADGQIVLLPPDATATARALVHVDASPQRVWQVISDPAHLRSSARSVKSLVVHQDQVRPDGKREQHLGYTLKVAFSEVRYNVIRIYDFDAGTMTWSLDDSRDNDIVSTDGRFTLRPHDGGTLFSYEVRLDSGRNLPTWLQDELTESSLKRFLEYVQQVAPQ